VMVHYVIGNHDCYSLTRTLHVHVLLAVPRFRWMHRVVCVQPVLDHAAFLYVTNRANCIVMSESHCDVGLRQSTFTTVDISLTGFCHHQSTTCQY